MNREEYISALAHNEKVKRIADNKAMKEYCDTNNPYSIGDIIQDHYHIIKIENISYKLGFMAILPSCVYAGPRYTSKLVPFKSKEMSRMGQSNVKRKL